MLEYWGIDQQSGPNTYQVRHIWTNNSLDLCQVLFEIEVPLNWIEQYSVMWVRIIPFI